MGFKLLPTPLVAESQSSPNPNPDLTSQPPCDECGSNPWKYRCPACSTRTCSLPCVKSHKQRTGCTGQKSHSEVVPLSKFDDNLLLSDYNFLEEAKRVAESARRARYGIGGRYYALPAHLRMLKDVARRRRTRVLFLPYGMSRRERNRSRYERRNDSILWTIEWRFHSTDVVLIDHGVDEHMNLHLVIEKHLMPSPWNHQLRPFCNEDVDNLKFFIRMNEGSKPLFRELKVRAPIGRQMAGVLIVEYPVVHVYLPSTSREFQVEKLTKPTRVNEKPSQPLENNPSPKGTVFREEEIDDNGSLETVVVDLMHSTKPAALVGPNNAKEAASTEGTGTPLQTVPKRSFEAAEPILGNKNWENGEGTHTNACDFDFEQDLKDAYSDLIRKANPDDFLCFDGINEGEQIESRQGALFACNGNSQMELEEGELEEGEIPS